MRNLIRNLKFCYFKWKFAHSVASCGKNLKVFGRVECDYPQNVMIGNECKVNKGVYINGRGGVEVGERCTLSPYSKIISSGYDLRNWAESGVREHSNRKIIVGDNVWLGAGAMIMPGVQITGEYVCIAPGAVVTHDIRESRVIAGGVPAKIIGRF